MIVSEEIPLPDAAFLSFGLIKSKNGKEIGKVKLGTYQDTEDDTKRKLEEDDEHR